MKKRGRQTLLTKKMQNAICEIQANANTIKTACDAVGISEKTYFNRCQKNPSFFTATRKARARAKMKLVEIIQLAALKNPLHACWLLKRSWPNEYSRVSVERVEQIGEPPERSVKILYQANKKELKELLRFPIHHSMYEPAAEEMPETPAPETLPADESEDVPGEPISDAPEEPPKVVPKFLRGRINPSWRGNGK